MRGLIIGLLLCVGSVVMYSCDKNQRLSTDKENITVYDNIVVETISKTSMSDTGTTFILLRHAEPTSGGGNAGLSTAGQARAEELRRMLGQASVSAVYATNLNRTMQTAQPVAREKGLAIQPYDAFASNALIDQCLDYYPKGVVLIVGHSNTVPALLNAMTGRKTYSDLRESEYDNLFIVHVTERGHATVTHLKY